MKFYTVEDRIYVVLREAKAYALLLADERQEAVEIFAFDIDMAVFRDYLRRNEDGWSYPSMPGYSVQPSKKMRAKSNG